MTDEPDNIDAAEEEIDFRPIPGDEHDHGDCISVSELGDIPVDALSVLLSVLLPRRRVTAGRENPHIWRIALVRLACLAHAIDLDGCGGMTLTQLASELGTTKANLSHCSINLRDGLNLPRRGGKSDQARQVYAERARRVWTRRKAAEDKP